MEKFNHLYGAIKIWTADNDKRPASTMWDYEVVKKAFYQNGTIKVGDNLPDNEGNNHTVTDVTLEILPQLEENKYGIDFSQTGDHNVNNMVVNITLKKA